MPRKKWCQESFFIFTASLPELRGLSRNIRKINNMKYYLNFIYFFLGIIKILININ